MEPLPIHVIWPTTESLRFEFTSHGQDVAPDVISTNQITIHDRLYRIEPITATGEAVVALRAHQPYLVLPLDKPYQGQYALVREQRRPSAPRPWVAVIDPLKSEVPNAAELDADYSVIHILGVDRTWTIHDDADNRPFDPDE